jgi:hypothetical protein
MTNESRMSSDGDRMKELEEERFRQRLLAVEREAAGLRNHVRVMGLGLIVTLGLACAAAFTPHLLEVGGNDVELEVLHVKEIVMEDDQGRARGRWTVDEEGNSRISLLDRQGRPRFNLSVLSGGYPGLSLMNANGQPRTALGINPDETTTLVFADGSGVARAVLGLSRADAAHLVFADADGVSRVALGLDGSGVGTVILPEDPSSSPSSGGGGR